MILYRLLHLVRILHNTSISVTHIIETPASHLLKFLFEPKKMFGSEINAAKHCQSGLTLENTAVAHINP